jgi:2-haloacid dehalogenase
VGNDRDMNARGLERSMTVKALLFDVFGTLVDWRSGVARDMQAVLAPLGFDIDWLAFVDAWRAEYQPTLETVRSGQQGYRKLDALHRENLKTVLDRFGMSNLGERARDRLVLAWHRLDAWPDVPEGLRRLGRGHLLAPCSNGNIALMADLARRNDFRWDAVLGADLARDYKPKEAVYLESCAAFSLPPAACMMVAAHSDDLEAAAACGLRTAHVARADEYGPGKGEAGPRCVVDIAARDLGHLAEQLGC